MVEPKPGLGEGNAAAWVTIGGTGDATSANWAGYGKHGPSDTSVDRFLSGDSGAYNPGADAKQILETNTLDWFHLVQARYAITGRKAPQGIGLDTKDAMDTFYFRQRDMHLDHLFGAAQRIEAALPKITQAHTDQQLAAQRLSGHWQGPTGGAVQDKIGKLGAWSDDALDELTAIPQTVYATVNEIKQCLQRKADAFAKLNMVHRINGVDMTNGESRGQGINTRNSDDENAGNDDVSVIINYSLRRGIGDNVRKQIQWIADTGVLGDRSALPRYDPHGNYKDQPGWAEVTEFDDKAQQICKIWTNQFCESAEGYFRAYSTLCAQTDKAVEQYLQVAVDALNNAGHLGKAPQPQDPGPSNPVPSNPGPATPGVPGPAVPGPAVPGPAQTTPAAAAPTTPTTSPAGTQANPAQILSSLASQASQTVQQGLTQTLQQGLSQIQNVAQQGLGSLGGNISGLGSQLSGLGSQLTDVKNLPGSKELANLSALGGNLTVTQSPNGTITAKVTGPDGKSQEYSMGIKDGVPFLKPGPAEPSDPTAAGPSDDKSSTPGSARPSGPGPGGASAAGSSAQSLTPAPSGVATPGSLPGHAAEPRSENPNAASGTGTNAPAAPGMPMSGIPHAPGGGGKSAPDSERPPSGIVPPKPLWTTVPGTGGEIPDGPAGPDGPGPELATVGPLDGNSPKPPTAGPELATVGPLESARPAPTSPSHVATVTDSPPAAAARPSTAGVKIEIDTGESK